MEGPSFRSAVVDLGSNSVRLVVFDGVRRNPRIIFNEKAVLRLGRGLEATGRLNEEGVAQAMVVMARYHAVARAVGADLFEVLATAAVRDAQNGAAFVDALRGVMPDVPIRILSGEEEAALSAAGVMCGIPHADGVLADIGGGSLELVRVADGAAHGARTLSLGVIRLTERAGGDLVRARAIAEADLATVPWLAEGAGRDLFIVGGAWRALARVHMAQTVYPLNILHHYSIRREEARDLTAMIAGAGPRGLERLPGVSRRRMEDLPVAAVVLRRVLRATNAARLVFCASGMREGWLMRHMPETVRREDPLLAAAEESARDLARDPTLAGPLIAWTDALFDTESAEQRRLRTAACLLSDTGSRDHPDYRAEQASARVLRQPWIGLDHYARAYLALCLAVRYDAEPGASYLVAVRALLDPASASHAEAVGHALRLAYSLSAGTPALLAGTALTIEGSRLHLRLAGKGAYAGEGMLRRLDDLARALGLTAATEFRWAA